VWLCWFVPNYINNFVWILTIVFLVKYLRVRKVARASKKLRLSLGPSSPRKEELGAPPWIVVAASVGKELVRGLRHLAGSGWLGLSTAATAASKWVWGRRRGFADSVSRSCIFPCQAYRQVGPFHRLWRLIGVPGGLHLACRRRRIEGAALWCS
jgi:hypothetical protein